MESFSMGENDTISGGVMIRVKKKGRPDLAPLLKL